MKSKSRGNLSWVWTVVVLVGLTAFAVYATSPALAISTAPALEKYDCRTLTSNSSLPQPSTSLKCAFDGKKLMIDEYGVMAPAPEGVYQRMDGRKCIVDKGGYTLACNWLKY